MSTIFSFRTSARCFFARLFSTAFRAVSIGAILASLCVAPAALAAKKVDGQAVKTEIVQSEVNINSADAEMLAASLKGVGLKKAEAIVQWRKKNGKFKSVDELALVKGIGESTIEKNRPKLKI